MKKIGMVLAAALLLLPTCALAKIDAQPEAGGKVAAGDTIAYTVTVEVSDPNGQVRVVLSKGMELAQNSVIAPEGELYFGSDGFVLMAELASGDKIEFSATVGETATEAVCTVTESVEETARHTIALPLEETVIEREPMQAVAQEEKPTDRTWAWIAMGSVALAGGSCWCICTVMRKKKRNDILDSAGDNQNKPAGT